MSPREGIYYVGMIAGMVAGVSFSRLMGWHHLVGLLCGIGLGFPLGIACENLYTRFMAKPTRSTRDRSCENPNCQWTGDPGASPTCPRCGQLLMR